MSTAAMSCPQCGATFADEKRVVKGQFDKLLALDHSRVQPWGSRHNLAFSTFTMQHPEGMHARRLAARWCDVACGSKRRQLRRSLAAAMRERWNLPPEERGGNSAPGNLAAHAKYAVTITDLGEFDADSYVHKLEEWGRATLAAWQ